MRKMHFSKFFAFLMAFALVLGAFASAVPTQAQETAEPTPLPAEEGTLTIWCDQTREPSVSAAGRAFTAAFGIPVRVQLMGFGDVRNNMNLAAPAGEGPDIIVGAHDWLGELYSNGLLAPIPLDDDLAAQFDPVALQAFTYEGNLVGLPYAVEAVAMYYNTDLVETPPTTWEEAAALSLELVEAGLVEQGIGIPPDPYHTYPLLSAYGGYIFGRDAEGNYNPSDVGLDSEGMIAGARELDALVKAGVFRDGISYDRLRELFQSGQLAMWITGPWALADIRASGVPYAVAPIPAGTTEARPFTGNQGFMLNAFSPNLQLAAAFLTEYIATEEVMMALFEADPRIPAFLPVRNMIEDEDILFFSTSAANGDPMPAIPQMSAVWSAWGNAVTLIYQQQGDPADIFAEAAAAVREQIASGN
jgi:maltose-binding protein MalE